MNKKSFTTNLKMFSRMSAAVVLTLCSTLALAQAFFADDASPANETTPHRVLLVDDDHIECPGAGYTTIQAAVNAAAPGDTVQVCPGTYDEQVEIAKRLTLEGVERNGKKASVVQPSNMIANADFFGPVAAAILVRDTSDVTIRNITVDGINNGMVCDPPPPYLDGIFYRNASGEIESVVIKNMITPQGCAYADALDVFSTEEQAQRVTVRDSSLHDYDIGGILCIGQGITFHAFRNVVTGSDRSDIGQAGIQLQGASGSIEDNTVLNNIDASCPSLTECGFVSHGIGVFSTEDVKIAGNTVGKSNVGIFAGAGADLGASDIRVLKNSVFDTYVFDGISVAGENNLVKDNLITNSERAGVRVRNGIHRVQNNTINEAAIGLRVTAGNNIASNQFFNVLLNQLVVLPAAPAEGTQGSSQQRDSIAPSVLKRDCLANEPQRDAHLMKLRD